MRLLHLSPFFRSALFLLFLASICSLAISPAAHGQATVGTGSIQGTILDPNGAAVASAKVFLISKDTGRKIPLDVTSTGQYNSGPITPGNYTIRVEAAGFKTVERGY